MPSPVVDRLESRVLFAAGPTVTNEMLLGPETGLTALVISFSAGLDPASAQNPDNYHFGGSRGNGRNVHKIPFDNPVYDDATHTVTLTMTEPLRLTRFKRLKVELASKKTGGISDPSGNLVDGDRNGVAGGNSDTRFKIGRGTHYSYRDSDGDSVTLRLKGGEGRPLTTLIGPNHNVIELWIATQHNTLVGSLRQHRHSNGLASIGRVVLNDASNVNGLTAPFAVGQTVIDGQIPIDSSLTTLP